MEPFSAEQTWQKNLAALPDAARRALCGDGPNPGVRVEGDPRQPSALLRAQDGRWVRLHSARDPVAEAARLVQPTNADRPHDLLVLIGPGLGYALDALEACGEGPAVIALEPFPELARAMLARRDWRPWLESGRLTLLVGPDYVGASDAWRALCGRSDAGCPPVVVGPVLAREFPSMASSARQIVHRVAEGARQNEAARRRLAGPYLLNSLANAPTIASSSDVRSLFRVFDDTPALIVSAGPSLDASLDALRQVRDRALVIAVDTALRPLLHAGIEPHLAVAVDPTPANARHLLDLPDSGTYAVFEGSIDTGAMRAFGHRAFVFRVADHHPWPWLRQLGIDPALLGAWGSVATSAFDLALKAGCNPIVFVGQDLGYTNGRPYCRGTTFEEDWAEVVAEGASLPEVWAALVSAAQTTTEPDLRGIPTPRTTAMRSFLEWFLDRIRAERGRTVVNATGAGFLQGAGILVRDLASLVGETFKERRDVAERIRLAHVAGRRAAEDRRRALAHRADLDGQVDAWVASLSDTVPRQLLDTTVRAAIASAAQPAPPSGGPRSASWSQGSPPSLFHPERAAAVRAVLLRAAIPDWVLSARPSLATGPSVASAYRRLRELLRAPALVSADAQPGSPRAVRPPSLAVPWRSEIKPAVRRFEEAVAICAIARRVPAEDRSDTAPLSASFSDLIAEASRDGESGARARLIALFLHLCDYVRADAAWGAIAAVLSSLERGVSAVADEPIARAHISLGIGRRGPRPGATLSWSQETDPPLLGVLSRRSPEPSVGNAAAVSPTRRTSRETTSSIRVRVVLPARRGVRERVCDIDGRMATAARLTGGMLGRAAVASALDAGRAVITEMHGFRSFALDEGGRLECWREWPERVLAAAPWGTDGGALAWHNGTDIWPSRGPCYLLWTPGTSAALRKIDLPFCPHVGVIDGSGRHLWVSHEGGVGVWSPSGDPHLLYPDLHLIGITQEGRHIRLDPSEDGLAGDPPAEPTAWLIDENDAVRQAALPALGSCTSTAHHGPWTARAFPYAGVVELACPGRAFELFCPKPFSLCWAGASLVVTTLDWEAFFFEKLADRIDRA